jgi:hypothetical protein
MRKFLLLMLVIGLLLGLAANATATVINFDDLPGDGVVPDGYASVTWYGEWNYYGEVQPPYNPHSPPNRVYDFLSDAHFTFGSPVIFDGAWFAGNAFATVQFQMYLDGTLVATSGILDPTDTPTFLDSGYAGLVDDVHVLSPSPDFFIMDDVTYHTGTGGVPEPGSLFLMGTGLTGLAGYIRRKIR